MSTAPRGNTDQAAYWESRASSWIEAEVWTNLVTGSFGRQTMDRLALEPGSRVLDVGCGTGPSTMELARRVAPGGSAVGIDISASLLAVARRRAEEEGVRNAEFVEGDAQTDALEAGTFDAAFSQFGVMFFSNPQAAFSNIARALRDAGRIAFACWQDLFANEWMMVPGAAVLEFTGTLPPMPGPGEPGPFSLSDSTRIEELLVDAGFVSIETVPSAEEVAIGADRIETVVSAMCQIGIVREVLQDNDDPAFHEQVRVAVHDALRDRVHDGQLRLAAAAWIVTAERRSR